MINKHINTKVTNQNAMKSYKNHLMIPISRVAFTKIFSVEKVRIWSINAVNTNNKCQWRVIVET